MKFEQKTLETGLNVIAEINNLTASAAIGFFVKTGARDETSKINGVSHFLEHMLFKGTQKLSAMQVNQAFDNIGAQFNAFTSEENTVYYAAVLPEYLEEAADLWTQLLRPSLRNDDFNIEKNVIKQEIAMYKDHPQFDVLDKCRTLHFGTHPCGNSVLGTNESIDALTCEQMKKYFTRRYAPNNITAVISGKIDFEKTCKIIEQGSKNWKPAEIERTTEPFAGTAKKQHIENPKLVREHICLMSQAVSYQDQRAYAATLLAMILGDDLGSRMYWELVDTAIAEAASTHHEAMDGTGVFYTYISTSPESAQKATDIVTRIFDEITANGITNEELQKAKNKLLSNITLKNETPMGRLVELGFNWTYLKEYRQIENEVQKIKNISVDDITALLEELELSRFTKVSLGPKTAP